jgi:excisionase family DNA binding protein
MDDRPLKLTSREISSCFCGSDWAQKFPPILTIEQAADLLQVPVGTLRDWRSRGLLGTCSRRLGKHVRFFRDRLLSLVFNEGLDDC